MGLTEVARIPLPAHGPEGGFDHAAVDPVTDRLYVAHPSNDCVEVVDLARRRHLRSLSGLRGVAGVWTDPDARLLFTSNRGEDTASVFRLSAEGEVLLHRVPTGARPNGLAFDAGRRLLLAAGVGDPGRASPPSATLIDVDSGAALGRVELPGRTRWATFHPGVGAFLVNIADPPRIARLGASPSEGWSSFSEIPARGPHGLERHPSGSPLYCACDDGTLVCIDVASRRATSAGRLAGPPDVLWTNARLGTLYAAIGDPGCVEVYRVDPFGPRERYVTGPDAHTLTVDPRRDEVHVFLPLSGEDLVLADTPDR